MHYFIRYSNKFIYLFIFYYKIFLNIIIIKMDMSKSMSKMFIISIIAGLLSTMNLWVIDINHVKLHLNDFYMVLLMAGWMLFFDSIINHKNMENTNLSLIISILIIMISIYSIRNQFLVNDEQYLKGMIPHHSMAILMSEKILLKTKNPEIKKLAKNIIYGQKNEITLMNNLLM